MKLFNRGDLVTIGEGGVLAVVRQVIMYDNEIKYVILNIQGEYINIKGDKIKELVRVRPLTFNHG
jgi:hypothetical protein